MAEGNTQHMLVVQVIGPVRYIQFEANNWPANFNRVRITSQLHHSDEPPTISRSAAAPGEGPLFALFRWPGPKHGARDEA